MEGCVPGLEVANISTIHIASAEVQSHGHSIGKGLEKVSRSSKRRVWGRAGR